MTNSDTRPTEQGETREEKFPPTRITITMEACSEKGMEWALAQAFMFARERWIGVTVSHKDEPTTRVSCRTTRLRKRKNGTG